MSAYQIAKTNGKYPDSMFAKKWPVKNGWHDSLRGIMKSLLGFNKLGGS